MEKKGDLLNQLAVITDLIENLTVQTNSSTIILELNQNEFDYTYQEIQKKYGRRMDKPKNSFSISIGMVDVVFNKSNV